MNDVEFEQLTKDIQDDLREKFCKQQNKHMINPPSYKNICMLETYCTICGVHLVMDENGEYVAMDNGVIDLERQNMQSNKLNPTTVNDKKD